MQTYRALALCLGLLCLLPSILSLTVHLVPHTHDDVGWLKTVDQYFIVDRTAYSRLRAATMYM